MAKRRFRIEGGRYGGEAVLGSVNPAFADYYAGGDEEEIVEAVLNADDWSNYDEQDDTGDELLDPDGPPSPSTDEDCYFNMWENDEFEHINSSYTDGGFFVYEVPADGSDDFDYEKEVGEFDGICVYSREGALFGDEHPGVEVNEEDEEGNKILHSTKAIGVDEVGTIYAPTGNTLTDDEGNEYPEIAPVTGYHLNLRKMRDEADSIITILEDADLTIDPPATPTRKFA